MEVPLPAHDLGDPDLDLPASAAEEAQPWEAAAPPEEDDLPWLEMPVGGARVHVADTPAPDDEMAGWAGWGLNDAPAADLTPPSPAADFAPSAPPADFAPAADFAREIVSDLAPPAEVAPPAEEPAAQSWEAMFAPADDFAASPAPAFVDATPAEQALLAEVEPAAEIPAEVATPAAESEAALELEAAGLATEGLPAGLADPELDALDAVPAAAVAATSAPAAEHPLSEVAEQLESIARALRVDPDAYLAAGAKDPLGMLVIGFVLGYRQRGSR